MPSMPQLRRISCLHIGICARTAFVCFFALESCDVSITGLDHCGSQWRASRTLLHGVELRH